METDARLLRARQEQEKHEEYLRQLDAELAQQPHQPYQPKEEEVAIETKTAPVLEAEEPKPKPAKAQHTPFEAIGLLRDGYHVDWVANRVGIPVEQLRRLVGKDGYIK